MIVNVVRDLIRSSISSSSSSRGREHFNEEENGGRSSVTALIVTLVTFIILLLLLSFFGMILWNYAVAGNGTGKGLVSVCKPASNIWQILALFVLLGLLFGR